MTTKGPRIIHPFLFAAYPAVSLYAHNLFRTRPAVFLQAVLFLALLAALAWFLAVLAVKERQRSAALASWGLLLFFSYGHWSTVLREWPMMASAIQERHVALLWVSLLVLGVISIARRADFGRLTLVLNRVAVCLLILPVAWAVPFAAPRWVYATPIPSPLVPRETFGRASRGPDIYYIILDGYARADVLQEVFHHDNTPFLKQLTKRGFRVLTKSRSNYPTTQLSLSSSLNGALLDELLPRADPSSADAQPFVALREKNRVGSFLKDRGYTIVSFNQEIQVDRYLIPPWRFRHFHEVLYGLTPLPRLTYQMRMPLADFQYELHRRDLLHIFRELPETASLDHPLFVFAHIIAPHPPFVFGRHGEKRNPPAVFSWDDGTGFPIQNLAYRMEGYIDQLEFVNQKTLEAIDGILASSPKPPVVILQSDHGSALRWDAKSLERTDLKERLSILNAIYLPPGEGVPFYDEMTPVNTFRLLFNHFFGTKLELLKDRSYFATFGHPYQRIDVTETLAQLEGIKK